MPLETVRVGTEDREVFILGDPLAASGRQSVITLIDARSFTGLYAALGQHANLLQNLAGTHDIQRAMEGTTGIPAVGTEGTKDTFCCGIIGFLPIATPTDIWTMIGSATKVVRITKIRLTGVATAATPVALQLIKRSTANTGGTTTTPTIVPNDTSDAAATAVITYYAAGANPTLGSTVGTMRSGFLNLGAAAAGAAGVLEWDFTNLNDKAIVLRGVAQAISINWNGAAVPAGTLLTIEVRFTEEPT